MRRPLPEIKVIAPLLFCLAFFLSGCSSVRIVEIHTLKPAPFPLKEIKRLTIGPFQGPGGEDFAYKVSSKLMETGRFEVYYSGLGAKAQGPANEKDGGVLSGNMEAYEVAEETGYTSLPKHRERRYFLDTAEKKRRWVAGNEFYRIIAPYRKRAGTVALTYRITKAGTGQVLASRSIKRAWEGVNIIDPDPGGRDIHPTPKDKSVRLLDNSSILRNLTDQAAQALSDQIAPHYKKEKMLWLEYDADSEAAGRLMSAGQYEDASDTMSKSVERLEGHGKKGIDRAYYDLALAFEAQAEFSKAETSFKKAIAINPDEFYIKALSASKAGAKDRVRLLEQQK